MLAGTLFSCSAPADKTPAGIKHLVVIGIDGLSVSGLQKAGARVMDSLTRTGSLSPHVRTVLPSSSSANWASMLMGAGPEQHGVTNNDWRLDDHTLEPVVSGKENRFPGIFGIIREQLPAAETGSIYQWDGFGNLYDHKDVSFDQTISAMDSTAIASASYIADKKPLFTWVHLDDVDGAGHHYGHGTPEYFASVRKADSCVGLIIDGIRKAGILEETLVIITSDHGGLGLGHGGHSLEEMTVPRIYSGAGIKKGYTVQLQEYQYDLASTIAFALGIKAPYEWIGRPVKAAFTGFEEPANSWKGIQLTAAPVIYPDAAGSQRAGTRFTDSTTVRMEAADGSQSPVYYTLDGTAPSPGSSQYTSPFILRHTAVIKARTINADSSVSAIATAYFRQAPADGQHGVTIRFYTGNNWNRLPDFSKLTPKASLQHPEIDIPFDQVKQLKAPDNSCFGLVYEAMLQIDQAGEYSFYTRSDDGSRLFIDGIPVVDNDGDHGILETTGSIRLTAGRHAIRVEFLNAGGGYWLDTYYKGPGLAKQIIPADKLFIR